jgi:hypothetical protein
MARCREIAGLLVSVAVAVVTIVTVPVAIPMVIVRHPPAPAFPVTFVEALIIVVGHHPRCTRIRWPGPITVMPLVMMADWIPIPFHPDKAWSGSEWPDGYDTRGRGRTNGDTHGYLSEEDTSHQQQEREQVLSHRGSVCSAGAILGSSSESIRLGASVGKLWGSEPPIV